MPRTFLMDILFVFLFGLLLNAFIFSIFNKINHHISNNYLWLLYTIHLILSVVYLAYANVTTSDSFAYYKSASASTEWQVLFEVGSPFIRFLAWPFCNFVGLSYLAVMHLFSYVGFLGIMLLYLAAKENVQLNLEPKNIGIAEIIFLLPNIHFWSSSLGKGSIMIFGIGLFFYGLSRFNKRYIQIIIGCLIIYFTRPHILFTSIVSVCIALLFSGKAISKGVKLFLISATLIAVYFLTDKVLEFTEIDSLNILNSNTLSHRAQELSKSTSGIDISNYNIISKMLTFWFRPLFIDATGLMGVFVSIENVVLLIMAIQCLFIFFKKFKRINGYYYSCFFAFILGSFALAQVSGNLGIALRQKAQLTPLFFIFYVKCMELKNNKLIYA